jgi:hypothetical protein
LYASAGLSFVRTEAQKLLKESRESKNIAIRMPLPVSSAPKTRWLLHPLQKTQSAIGTALILYRALTVAAR